MRADLVVVVQPRWQCFVAAVCSFVGTITRLHNKPHAIAERRPTIIVRRVTPLEHDNQHLIVLGARPSIPATIATMTRVAINPQMLRWARDRSGRDSADLHVQFPQLERWEQQELQPTLKQLEQFARATYTPIGFLFLPEPIEEVVPIPDFRTVADRGVARPSPNLLDTIYLCQQRQEWFREHALEQGFSPIPFIGSLRLGASVEDAARQIAVWLHFDWPTRQQSASWEEALRQFITHADTAGVMVMCSGVVGSNNRRSLDPAEFRGFALSDALAPLIFINGADSKSAQMFTLAHKLAHLGLGQSGVSDIDASGVSNSQVEQWCNRVAAELLVPMHLLRAELRDQESLDAAKQRLARLFKVSSLVILRRFLDVGRIQQGEFWALYRAEVERLMSLQRSSGGGNFYLSQAARVSKRFVRALVGSALEGHTLYRDAMRMVGVSRVETFHELGRSVGVIV